jgi:hypothetical protein
MMAPWNVLPCIISLGVDVRRRDIIKNVTYNDYEPSLSPNRHLSRAFLPRLQKFISARGGAVFRRRDERRLNFG